jgi:hypothetical protein
LPLTNVSRGSLGLRGVEYVLISAIDSCFYCLGLVSKFDGKEMADRGNQRRKAIDD